MLFEPPSFGRRAFLGLRDILLVPSSPHACAIACKNAQIELKSKPKSGGSGGNATEVMKGERLRKTETTMFMKEHASLWICGRKAALNCRVVLLTVLFYFAIRRSYFLSLDITPALLLLPPIIQNGSLAFSPQIHATRPAGGLFQPRIGQGRYLACQFQRKWPRFRTRLPLTGVGVVVAKEKTGKSLAPLRSLCTFAHAAAFSHSFLKKGTLSGFVIVQRCNAFKIRIFLFTQVIIPLTNRTAFTTPPLARSYYEKANYV